MYTFENVVDFKIIIVKLRDSTRLELWWVGVVITHELLDGSQKRQTNKCARFIKTKLTRLYTVNELANGRLVGGKRRYKDNSQDKTALSPGRLSTILHHAKKKYREEYENIENLNEVINSV